MDTEEIVCVHVTLKFVIFKSIEKNESSLCDNFIINLAEANDIEAFNKSKQYFIQKFHQILRKKKKNEYECLLNGTITEIATFLSQHMELYIQISKVKYEIGEQSDGDGLARVDTGGVDEDGVAADQANAERKKHPLLANQKREPNGPTSQGRNKIHLLKSVDLVEDDIQFKNGQIYFKCLFKDLLSDDFEFIHHNKYENISNFYVSNDFIFSISVKFEECMLKRRDLEGCGKRGCGSDHGDLYYAPCYDRYACEPVDKRARKYWHLVNLWHMTNLFYLHINFNTYEESFFRQNCVEVTVGDMLQNLSLKDDHDGSTSGAKRNESGFASPGGRDADRINDNRRDEDDNSPMGCHFSLILIDQVEELYDYFRLNDIHIIFNKIKLEVERKGVFFSHHKKSSNLWIRYKDMERMTCQLSTHSGSVPSLNFQATIMSICVRARGGEQGGERLINSLRCRSSGGEFNANGSQSGHGTDSSISPHPRYTKEKYRHEGGSNSPRWESGLYAHKKEVDSPKDQILKWNLFLSVERCHILELSNIYAEKRKTRQSDFFLKIESGLLDRCFVSSFYPFEENRQIELKNCHVSHDLQVKDSDPCDQLEGQTVHFQLALREEDPEAEGIQSDPNECIRSGINIGVGDFPLKNVSKELKATLMNEGGVPPQRDYYQFEFCVPLYLHVFKEKYLTSELSVHVFLSARQGGGDQVGAKVGSPQEEVLTPDQSGDHLVKCPPKNEAIPCNIYEFKLWKEEEERRMAEMLKRREQNVMKKLIKRYEAMERERKNEIEKKKNELKEIIIKVKEEQINVKKNENLVKIKDKQLNDEIYMLEKKLKKIKHAYEKSLAYFKQKLRKAHLEESLVKENDQLLSSYKNALSKVKKLSKENEEMKSILGKYNSRDNAIISKTYFEELKDELKRLKLFQQQTVLSRDRAGYTHNGEDAQGGATHNNSYIKTVRKNRKRIIQLIGNFVPQIEQIYDLTNDDLLEEKVRSILRDVQEVRLILRAEVKELDRASPEDWLGDSSDGLADLSVAQSLDRIEDRVVSQSPNNQYMDAYTVELPEEALAIRTDPSRTLRRNPLRKAPPLGRHASLVKHPKGKNPPPQRSLLKGKGVHIPSKGIGAPFREALPHAKLLSEKREHAPPKDSAPISQTDGFAKRDKPSDNAKMIENLKREIKRLIETGIYNEDDTIIKNMKKKLNGLL
ncbi:Cg7 protein, putative [Plasmodium knowlesi strain H]|uniref:Cg7 protein, putative n=3 Tax=Plasmodium knowlesi TaxID=5850 RepID=A0A5K1V8R1_PLAKH|nr:Cg7 protein, putative [Plasmodium knowlesi strain H]OTN68721.1 putative Cg7 protein [Plasmodium knowlesi]CAA9986160.1 Cg7 protein, putative [Plasmodium knowlesi strain H]SBO25350.1 Cg7 protein, putative [Plasmodium knowlesi strain H]SBO27655.1 Cg7 protein, putative [Plasmodium knowlesi strain H]VVS75634.1 Cg7 protein, putative [Plasmodium knowlesi strain H]|eukprot:XP_002257571.1 Cg7 protein, putative [Plasmodium knowlesi strain H]